jgi:FixJ family two-component response regulator
LLQLILTVLLPAAGIIVLHGIKDRSEVNGLELAKQLSGLRPNLKHLYMSGYTADVIAHRGILDEGVNFIQKPSRSDEFAARVR